MSGDYHGGDSSILVQYGISEELTGMFDSLRETPGLAGDKFRQQDVNQLAQSVICRNYGKACLELSYLLYAVVRRAALVPRTSRYSPLLDFFWISESISPRRFRLAFADLQDNAALQLGKDFLHISVDSSQFTISPTRVGYLAVLFELLVNISPDIVQRTETQLADASLPQLKDFASQLQKGVYAYLKDHLAPAQQQRRFRFLSQWLRNHDSQSTLTESVSDDKVLAFWQQMALAKDDGLGFRRYRTVVENFISLLQALSIGSNKREVAQAAAIGYDTDGGEIHPELLDEWLTAREDEIEVGWLAGSPKFVSKQQLQWLEPLMSAGSVLVRLPLSLIRMRLLGDRQSELLQAQRSGDQDKVRHKLAQSQPILYRDYLTQGETLDGALAKVRLAIVHMFAELRQSAALQPMAQLLPPEEWAEIKATLLTIRQQLLSDGEGEADGGQALVAQITDTFFAQLAQYRLQHPPVNKLLQQAQAAFKVNNRLGFKHLPDIEALAEYELGFETLGLCRAQLSRLQQQIDGLFATEAQLAEKSAADLAIFHSIFAQMYITND